MTKERSQLMNEELFFPAFLERLINKKLTKEQFIKDKIQKSTQGYDRTQFVDEIYKLVEKNEKLKDEIKGLNKGLLKLKNRRDIYKRRDLKQKLKIKQLSKEIGRLKEQNKFLMKRDNILQNLEQWLEIQSFDTSIGVFTSSAYQKVLNKIKDLKGSDNNE